jgi:hypothetical protein
MNEYVYEYESEYVDMKWMNEYHRLKKILYIHNPPGIFRNSNFHWDHMYISILHIWYNSIYIYIISYFYIEKHPQYIYIYHEVNPWCFANKIMCFVLNDSCQEEDFLYNYFFKWLDICHLYVSLGCSKLGPSQ